MADALQEMAVFSKVVAAGSLSAAARELGLSPALVSRRLAGSGSTPRCAPRQPHDTEPASHRRKAPLLRRLHAGAGGDRGSRRAVSAGRVEPQGALESRCLPRLATSTSRRSCRSSRRAIRRCSSRSACPIAASTSSTKASISPSASRICRTRRSRRASSRPNRRVVCASPAYLAAHGTPRTPEELSQHNCLTTTRLRHELGVQGVPTARPARCACSGRYACDNWEVLREWALAGLGIALKSTWDVHRQLAGRLARFALPGLCVRTPTWRSTRSIRTGASCPRRRACSSSSSPQSFGPEPYWDRPAARARPRIRPRAAA